MIKNNMSRVVLLVVLFYGFLICCQGSVSTSTPFCRQISPTFSTGLVEIFTDADLCVTMRFAGQLYADMNHQIVRYDFTFLSGNGQTPLNQSVWADANSKLAYVFDWDSGVCSVGDYPYPVGSNTLPDNTVSLGSFLLGTQEVDSLFIPATEASQGYAAEISVTRGTCLPVSVLIIDSTLKQLVLTESYFNFVPLVPPYVFRLPDACKKSSLVRSLTSSTPLAPAIRRFLNRPRSFIF